MRYLLDSNIVIALMARHRGVAARLAGFDRQTVALSSLVMHELLFGAYGSAQVDINLARLNALRLPVFAFDAEDARAAGHIRADLARKGTPIGPYYVLVAGQALARDLTVVTNNVREFARVEGLRLEDWMAV